MDVNNRKNVYEEEYRWRQGTPNYGVSAVSAAAYFNTLDREYGHVEPERVVEEAKPDDALLHPCFEWDDEKAAYRYRVGQARGLIGSIVKVRVENHVDPQTYRVFVNTSQGNHKACYQHIDVALSNPETRKNLLENARREARTFIAKYRTLTELASIIPALKNFVDDTDGESDFARVASEDRPSAGAR